MITGPLQARSLGPSGRGDLAAILVPLTILPTLLDLGLTAYIVRARARGEPRNVLLGSLVPLSLAFSLVGVAAAFPLAHLIANGRGIVQTGITVGLLMSPIWVISLTAQGIPWGEERWRLLTFVRIAAPVVTALSMIVLYTVDSLTVASAFVVFIGASLISTAPLVAVMARSGRWQFKRDTMREGTRFGAKAWLGSLFNATDARLDQLLMAGLVSPRELGLYAVAVNVASFPNSFIGAIATAINPRVAQGNNELVKRSCRVSVLLITFATIAMAVVVPIMIRVLFGSAFNGAILLTWVLLVSTISGTVSAALLSALSASGHPGAAARTQMFVLAPTVIALVVLLPSTGALGAAVIATASSLTKFCALLSQALRILGGRARDYLVIQRSDLRSVALAVRSRR
ncbi:MAG TPA: oligosaccharide flippase family protein [Solirubrobacteraceae bacterium]|nr:oligosaccharide flippase family protein [Solirubrobacteraceae bacterium]